MELAPRSGDAGNGDDIGAFRQGDEITRWALARYLLGRALAVQLNRVLLALAALVIAVAALVYLGGASALAILIGLVALAVLAARSVLGAVLRRTTMANMSPGAERELRMLVADTRADVGRELRRLGLPGRPWNFPALLVRLAGRRRSDTVRRLRDFDIERVVPASRLDEFHLLVAAQASRGATRR